MPVDIGRPNCLAIRTASFPRPTSHFLLVKESTACALNAALTLPYHHLIPSVHDIPRCTSHLRPLFSSILVFSTTAENLNIIAQSYIQFQRSYSLLFTQQNVKRLDFLDSTG